MSYGEFEPPAQSDFELLTLLNRPSPDPIIAIRKVEKCNSLINGIKKSKNPITDSRMLLVQQAEMKIRRISQEFDLGCRLKEDRLEEKESPQTS